MQLASKDPEVTCHYYTVSEYPEVLVIIIQFAGKDPEVTCHYTVCEYPEVTCHYYPVRE